MVPGGTCHVVRAFFKWRSITFLLFQWGNTLTVVILTMPWVTVSPEEMKKDTVGWLSRP